MRSRGRKAVNRWILPAVVLIVLSLAAVFAAIPGPEGDYTKVLVVRMHILGGTVTNDTAEIRYGHPPATAFRSGPFAGKLVDAGGGTVREFSAWDPGTQVGDGVELLENGTEILHTVEVNAKERDLLLVLPFTGTEAGLSLYDKRSGRLVKSVDLTPARTVFARTYPMDPDSSSRKEEFPPLPGLPAMLAGGVILVLAFVAMIVLMIRRR
jgi:hypothetical protein